MRTEQLKYILEIEKQHSISSAAAELYMGPTTLSSILKGAEEELGFPIFTRVSSGVIPTEEGKEALSIIRQIQQNYDAIVKLGDFLPVDNQVVNVLTSPSINAMALPISIAFHREFSTGAIEFGIRAGDAVGPALIKGDAAIGVTYWRRGGTDEYSLTSSKYQVKAKDLFRDHMYLLVRKDHPLAARDFVLVEQICYLSLALLPNYNNNDGSFSYPTNYGPGNHYSTFPDIPQIKQAILRHNIVAALSGFAIMSDQSVPLCEFKPLLIVYPAGRVNELELCVIHRNEDNMRLREIRTVEIIEDYFSHLEYPPFSPEALSPIPTSNC